MFVDADDIDTVLLVVADSLRADTAREWMPFLQELGDEGVRCGSCFAVGPHTPSSMTGMVQSRLPVDGGYGTVLPSSPPTIAEVLSADGVACGGWHCNPHTLAERDFHRGFGVYADLIEEGQLNDPHERTDSNGSGSSNLRYRIRELADTVGVRPAVDALAEQLKRRGYLTVDPRVPASETVDAFETWPARRDPDRRFAYLHLMDTHMPYRPPAAHWESSASPPAAHRSSTSD